MRAKHTGLAVLVDCCIIPNARSLFDPSVGLLVEENNNLDDDDVPQQQETQQQHCRPQVLAVGSIASFGLDAAIRLVVSSHYGIGP